MLSVTLQGPELLCRRIVVEVEKMMHDKIFVVAEFTLQGFCWNGLCVLYKEDTTKTM